LWLKVHIIDNDENLTKLQETCIKEKKFVLDTETTSLNIMEAELVWISVYIDDERIYYINRLHSWNRISDWVLQKFVKSILSSDSLIIWHNLKYDLEILDLFLKNSIKRQNQKQDEFLGQTSFNF
jgi:DNA polymerase I-like protein with 3'-5' exonuclease and polymerase domains